MSIGNRVKALLFALFIQIFIAGLICFAGLLDPLIGLWLAVVYFFVIGFYLMYHFLLQILNREI